jgi:hypothetical protein
MHLHLSGAALYLDTQRKQAVDSTVNRAFRCSLLLAL